MMKNKYTGDSSGGGGGRGGDVENRTVILLFEDVSIRHAFIRKVYSILFMQLAFTFGIVLMFIYYEPMREYTHKNPTLFWVCLGVSIVLLLALACCENLRRTVPLNFMLLGIFTIAESVILGYVCSFVHPHIVMLALGITLLISFALTVFAMQTRMDFTMCGTGLMICGLVLMVLGLVSLFWPGETLHLVFCWFGACLLSMYLIYDTQLMMGGNHAYSISPEEYIFGALNLYVDIITLFMFILSLLESSN